MKIVMLGNTNVGKTTYMASLYGLMQQRIEGFSLKAANNGDGSRLLDLATAISLGKYPSPTAQRGEYDFSLQYQGKEVLSFCWADYRGGAIREKGESSEQAKLLINDLREADGIMMFCDCDALARKDFRSSEIRRMTSLIAQAMQNVENPISLAIILTKTDKVRRISEDLIHPFSGLIDIINASDYVLGSLIPIACGTQFINIPMPLLFALYAGVYMQTLALAYMVEYLSGIDDEYRQKSKGFGGFLRKVGDVLVGNDTDEEIANYALAMAYEKYQELESIKEPVSALSSYIDKLPIIKQELNIKDYAEACSKLKFSQKVSSPVNRMYQDPFDFFVS